MNFLLGRKKKSLLPILALYNKRKEKKKMSTYTYTYSDNCSMAISYCMCILGRIITYSAVRLLYIEMGTLWCE